MTAYHVLHVCTGNICRSPMAELIMRAGLEQRFGPSVDVEVRGAGTYGGHAGGPMHAPAAEVLGELGLDGSGFTSSWLREPQVQWADLVVTATAEHRSAVLQLEPRALRRTFTLRELARLARQVGADRLPVGSPGERLRALVALAGELRALHPSPGRGADDIGDPYGGPMEEYRATARAISGALDDILRPL